MRIAIVGCGKIAEDEHVPAIAACPVFDLAAVARGRGEPPAGTPRFTELIAAGESDVDVAPLRAVADVCLVGARESTAPFGWET